MPLWPFKKRPKTDKSATSAQQDPEQAVTTKSSADRSQNLQGTAVPVAQSVPSSSATRRAQDSRQASMSQSAVRSPPRTSATNKDGITGQRNDSQENITALPPTAQLNESPHLRPADSERAEIPHEFRPNASTTSVHRDGSVSKPATLRSKRSTFDTKSMKRRSTSKKKEDYWREEEIKAMNAVPPVPKRPGDGPPRKDSYKRRTFDSTTVNENRDAIQALADQDTSAMPTVEQNGYQVQHFWINPRPAVRLSSIPAYTLDNSPQTPMPLPRDISQKLKEKAPMKESRRLKTVGDEVDDLDSNDIRAVLERDAKRREKKDRERQERIERKMKETGTSTGRRRASSGKRRRDAQAEKALEAGTPPVPIPPRPENIRAQSSIHPALRDEPVLNDADVAGLGIGPSRQQDAEDPFKDPVAAHRAETEKKLEEGLSPDAQDTENPFEDPVIETAREVRMSTAMTPPLSPVDRNRRSAGRIPLEDLTTTALPPAASAPVSATTPQSEPLSPTSINRRSGSESNRRAGAWASFFKRGSTQRESKAVDNTSFSNTSRDDMNRRSLPPHLVQERVSPFQRNASGAPTRTMSKFREDLPDAPISPPDSRMQSPELPANAAAIAAAAVVAHEENTRGDGNEPVARDSAVESGVRSDTPVSPVRGHAPMSASMASVDSEGSWLASGGSIKRASQQSGLSRSLGSMNRRKTPDFNASYEDLGTTGGDKDAEYVHRGAEARKSAQLGRVVDSAGINAAEGESQSADDQAVDPLTVHESMRRTPKLVQADPAVRSREGLLSEYAGGEHQIASSVASKDDSPDEDEDQIGAKLESARSVDYGSGHARKVSAGSAILLDVAPRRMSAALNSPVSPVTSTASPTAKDKSDEASEVD